MKTFIAKSILMLAVILGTASAHADSGLAKKLANPVGSLVSVPFQFNYDNGYGTADGEKLFVNIQPVIPITLNEDWNIISRTIVPVVWQDDIAGPSGDQFGLGDTFQSFWVSPKKPAPMGSLGNMVWGLGPAISLPTGTDDLLSSEKWSAGPTGLVIFLKGPWVYGGLANHVWSFAGESDRADVNNTFLQPLVNYITKSAWTFGLNSETNYNWETEEWSVPINAMVSKLVTIGKQKVSFQVGARYWIESPDSGPDGWGARFTITLIFPQK